MPRIQSADGVPPRNLWKAKGLFKGYTPFSDSSKSRDTYPDHSGPCHSFEPMKLKRRELNDLDVLIEMKYCGVCHSDLHIAAGHMENVLGKVEYPCVPGHELAGVVKQIGSKVTKFSVGDHIGVGCMVDSCLECSKCKEGQEQKCSKQVGTYAGKDWSGRAQVPERQQTIGGYTSVMVVQERFGIKIPKSYPLDMAGPVMCAGITMYDPLKAFNAKPGREWVVGLMLRDCKGTAVGMA
eukprot:s1161_g17.t1